VLGRDDENAAMLKMARLQAAKGHRLQMIETMLAANQFRGFADFLDQPRVQDELKDIAVRLGHRPERAGEPGASFD
jgi:molybdenum cofactor biosynthesis enzyme MoaA